MELTTAQMFEQEKTSRLIDQTTDVKDLKRIAHLLLKAWMMQRAATGWIIASGSSPMARASADDAPWDDPLR